MKYAFPIAIVLSGTAALALAEASEKEFVNLMNRVQARVASGEVKALDELNTLPPQWATPAFLTIFKQNNVKDATPQMRAIAARCAELAIASPENQEYIIKLLKGKPANNSIFFQQEAAIRCLSLVRSATTVRILGGSLDEVDAEEIGPKVTNALTALKLPDAPISPNQRVRDADALTKWKQWWGANKDKYAGIDPLL